ncbi:hypothetical protein KC316_g54 [Hortaea werneckii]|nr:hypothetical protein KC316_g54 [Hortaea werneckii]
MSGKPFLLLPSEHWLITLVCSWKNYYETDIIDGWMYKYVQDNAMDKLTSSPLLSALTIPSGCTIDSMHPTSNIAAGEMLIKHVYDSIRQSKYWDDTLLIINFDEVCHC